MHMMPTFSCPNCSIEIGVCGQLLLLKWYAQNQKSPLELPRDRVPALLLLPLPPLLLLASEATINIVEKARRTRVLKEHMSDETGSRRFGV